MGLVTKLSRYGQFYAPGTQPKMTMYTNYELRKKAPKELFDFYEKRAIQGRA